MLRIIVTNNHAGLPLQRVKHEAQHGDHENLLLNDDSADGEGRFIGTVSYHIRKTPLGATNVLLCILHSVFFCTLPSVELAGTVCTSPETQDIQIELLHKSLRAFTTSPS